MEILKTVEDAGQSKQTALLEAENAFLWTRITALRDSRQVLIGLLQQQIAEEQNRVALLEQDIARLKKENLYYKKQRLQGNRDGH